MATPRLTMSKTKEILRQKWQLERSHREVARSLSVSPGVVGATLARAAKAGLARWSDVDGLDDAALEERLGRELAGAEATSLALRDTGAFPSARAARVLWIGVEPDAALEDLRERSLRGFAAAGPRLAELVRKDRERGFRPHVTVARPKGRGGAEGPAPPAFTSLPLLRRVEVGRVELLESRRVPGEANRYVPIAGWDLRS